jgi:hypothetical protein
MRPYLELPRELWIEIFGKSWARRNGTARCPRTLPGLRTCYRTRRAQKTRRALVRGSGSTMNRHTHTQPQKRAARDKRGPGAPHTPCRHTTSATRRPAREERTAHTQFKFECDRAPSECAGPGSRRGRRHGLQHDGDGAASRRRYGGGRVYMELTIDGLASRPAGGLVWPDGVKASSMESPDGGTRATGATESTSAEWSGGRRAVSLGPTAYRRGEGSINVNPWVVLSASPVEQLLDAKTS